MANTVKIKVKVEDDGTLSIVGKKAKGAANSMDQLAGRSTAADRALKGAGGISSNTTKNFAKMSQGITGGLVPAYATFAAHIFALSAAFNFLKNAADIENLRKAQTSYAVSTGTAIRSITNSIREASQGMLDFRAAAEAAAIGAAKGFTTSQMTSLAEGAAKASAALGRSYDDTFNRLLRGVSKAEPELLDELGITLRLEKATKDYALAIGTTEDKLTAAQRSQAVYNETMRQLNENFGDIETMSNPFVKLSNTFDDLIKKITQQVLPAFVSIAEFLNNNAKAAATAIAAIAALILLNITGLKNGVLRIFSAIGSGISGTASIMGKKFSSALSGILSLSTKGANKLKELEDRMKDAGAKAKTLSQQFEKGGSSKLLQKVGAGTPLSGLDKAILTKSIAAAERQLKEFGKISSGIFENASEEMLNEFKDAFNKMGTESKKTGAKIARTFLAPVNIGLKAIAKTASFATIAVGKLKRGFELAGVAARAFGKATVILGVLQELYFIFEKISSQPATLVDNVMKMFSNILKMVQFFGNVWVKFINGIIDRLPDKVKSMMGLDEIGPALGEFTFADSFEQNMSKITDTMLNAFGISYEALQAQEEETRKIEEREQRIADIISGYSALKLDIADQIKAVTKAPSGRKTEVIATSIQTLPIAKAIEDSLYSAESQAALDKMLAEYDFSLFGENFNNAIVNRDVTALEALSSEAGNYVSNLNSLQDAVDNAMSTLDTSDPLGLKVQLNALIETARAADANAAAINQVSEAFNVLDKLGTKPVLEISANADQLIQEKLYLQDEQRAFQLEKLTRVAALFGEQTALNNNITEESLALRGLQNELERELFKENFRMNEGQQAVHEQEVERLNDEIALQKEKLRIAINNSLEITQLGQTIGDSLTSSLSSAFDGIIQGTTTVKDAMANMAKNILSSMAQVIAKMLAMKVLTAALGGTSFGNFLNIPQNRYGGVLSNGSKVAGYATGGVAKGSQAGYPAILHGTEAVVPLPNGKSIPVQMNGAGQNNVTVNVSIDNQGNASTNTQQDSAQAGNLGQAIARAVQMELQNQKRSGGILSPYGAA